MQKEVEELKQLVNQDYWQGHDSGKVHLTETNKAQLQSVFINGLSKDGITLKLSTGKDSFFIRKTGNNRCDYVVLSQKDGKKYALFIDLKSKHIKDSDVIEQIPHAVDGANYNEYAEVVYQLKASSCYFEFIHHVLADFRGVTTLSSDYPKDTSRAFLILHSHAFGNRPHGLQQTIARTRLKIKNNSPETALVLYAENDDTLDFQSLILN